MQGLYTNLPLNGLFKGLECRHEFLLANPKLFDMVSIGEFRQLDFEEKCEVVTYQASYLVSRWIGDCKIFLYNADHFFIEVFYSTRYQRVLLIHAFDQTQGLVPYLDNISLAGLYSKPIM
jgi:hypothetical protein